MTASQASNRSIDAQTILDAALARVASDGLSGVTLRDLAQAVGKSTTVVIGHFGSKANLLNAVGEEALRLDTLFHADFFAQIAGLQLNRDNLLAVITRYLRLRAGQDAGFVRIWEALLIDVEILEERRDLLRRWEAMRQDSWARHLIDSGGPTELASPLSAYLVLEQFYAGALLHRGDYEAIAAEGLGGLIDRFLSNPEGAPTATFWYRENLTLPTPPGAGLERDSMRLKLLDIAADQVLAGGVGAITNRSVSAVIGTSTSTIAHHWPDMRHFVLDSVWHSVFRDMPRHLSGEHPQGDQATVDLDTMAARLAAMATLPKANEGFYVKYARMIASVCVEARRDPSLRDLAMLLRGPEGGGTYYHSAGVWPADFNLTRLAATRFALWFKGRALTASATGRPLDIADLKWAAEALVARRVQ